jgi:hypothetical protein
VNLSLWTISFFDTVIRIILICINTILSRKGSVLKTIKTFIVLRIQGFIRVWRNKDIFQ